MNQKTKKQEIVAKIKDLGSKYNVIGLANLESLPAPQLQKIRAKLKDIMVLFMAKKTLMRIAFNDLEANKKNISGMSSFLKGMPALIFSNENPFKLIRKLNENKTAAPAKPGQIAPNDIVVKAGPTNFAPGPIIGELGKFGIKTEVKNGKLAIKDDVVVAKEGDVISPALASLLTRLDINPMEVGVNLIAVYEDGLIFSGDILKTEPETYISNLGFAANEALKLALGIKYISKETIESLIKESYSDAFRLTLGINFPTKESIKFLLAKANAQGMNLKNNTEG